MNDWTRVVAATMSTWAAASAGACADLPAHLGMPPGPGIWCRRLSLHPVPRDHEERLAQSLRRITGLAGLRFQPDGALTLGDASLAKSGAPTARLIVKAALASGMAFIIEDHSGSELLHFAQLDAGTTLSDWLGPSQPLLLWRLWLDFKDLSGFEASPGVRAAFDPGFAVLHELLHGLGFRDPEDGGQVGPLEEVLNRARAELGLPLRDRYAAETLAVGERMLAVRLRFRRAAAAADRGKARFEYLSYLLDGRMLPRTGEEDSFSAVCCPPARRSRSRN
jgi:hypothetical protein